MAILRLSSVALLWTSLIYVFVACADQSSDQGSGPSSGDDASTTDDGTARGDGSSASRDGSSDASTMPSCPALVHACDGRACGDNCAMGSCGTCARGTACNLAGQCVSCTPSCTNRACGDDGCGGSCGSCTTGTTCSLGECIKGAAQDVDELLSMYYLNQYRITQTPRVASCVCRPGPASGDFSWCSAQDPWCAGVDPTDMRCDPGAVLPSRFNADRLLTSRLIAQHQMTYVETTGNGWCGHADPMACTCNGSPCTAAMPGAMCMGSLQDRFGAYLSGVGMQNIWCGCPSPDGAAITGDPWHCYATILPGSNDFAIGQAGGPGACYQVQDPGGDSSFEAVVIDDEAVSTGSQMVEVTVWPGGRPPGRDASYTLGLSHIDQVTKVMLSEDPCFANAQWQPYAQTVPFQLSAGNGRKVVYARVMDENGLTAASWDSIYLGVDPKAYPDVQSYVKALEPLAIDATQEGMKRIRQVRLPALPASGFDTFEYASGQHREVEDMGNWWGNFQVVDDPDASMGKAVSLAPSGMMGGGFAYSYFGGVEIPPTRGDIYLRVKTADNTSSSTVAAISFREDTCNGTRPGVAPGARNIAGTDFSSPGKYEWFRMPFKRAYDCSLFYVEIGAGAGVLLDRWDLYEDAQPVVPTQSAPGVTLDFSMRNYRGIELQVRFVNSTTGSWADGPRINPYCPLCAP